jgi:hypothetical protein
MKAVWLVTAIMAIGCAAAHATDYYVNNAMGNDGYDGKTATAGVAPAGPLATIMKAVKRAGPGDTIHVKANPEPYRELVEFTKGGERGKPIILDGHGAVVSGSDLCPPDGWTDVGGGVFTRRDVVSYYVLVADGKLLFAKQASDCLNPGEICYSVPERRFFFNPPAGKKAADCKVEATQPDGAALTVDPKQWGPAGVAIKSVMRAPAGAAAPVSIKVDGVEAAFAAVHERLAPGEWCTEDVPDGKPMSINGVRRTLRMYYRPPAGKTPADLKLECSVRRDGMELGGDIAHIVIKNFTVQFPWDDGYNLAGAVKDTQFLNCDARHCGDQGFSAHGFCETVVDGAVYEDCSQGVANVNEGGFSVTRNVVIARSRGPAFLIQHEARHELQNAVLVNNASGISGANIRLDNVLIVSTSTNGPRPYIALQSSGGVEARRLTIAGDFTTLVRTDVSRPTRLEECLFATGKQGWHVRLDAPFDAIRMKDVVAGPGGGVTWGSTPPWKAQPLGEWFKAAAQAGVASNAQETAVDLTAGILAGQRPKDVPKTVGCDQAILDRFRAYVTAGGRP